MRMTLLVVISALLVGCASAKPMGGVAIGFQVDDQTDYWLQTQRPWQCSKNIPFKAKAGVETEENLRVYLEHRSWLLCGEPFNGDDPETYNWTLWLEKEWGGQ